MRLAIAAGILAHALPATGESERIQFMKARMSSVADTSMNLADMTDYHIRDKQTDRDFFAQFKQKASERSALVNQVNAVECDPKSDDIDVGILSCGMGKYCLESSGSELGGVCVNQVVERGLQGSGFLPPICNASDPIYAPYNCNCTGFDPYTYVGEIDCVSGLLCYDDTFDLCFVSSYSLYSDGQNYTTVECAYFVTPYSQVSCTIYGNLYDDYGGCAILFNGDVCNSCTTQADGCTQFDCSNTCAPGLVGDVCNDYLFPILDPNVTYPLCLGGGSPTVTPEISAPPSSTPESAPPSMGPDMAGTMPPVSMGPSMAGTAPPSMGPDMTVEPMPVTPAPVESPVDPSPTPAPQAPEATEAPTEEVTETPTESAAVKATVSLLGLSLGVLAYFAA